MKGKNRVVESDPWPQIILVNGPSSAGKTTLCRALQQKILEPYLVVGFDDFIFMAASRYYRGADGARQDARDDFTALGVEMVKTSAPGAPPSVTAKFGAAFRRLVDSMAPAVRALVDGGNPVIFDHVLHDRAMYESYRQATAELDVFTVGVTCPLEVLEKRERARGDRVLGRARGLADVVHGFCAYDVTVDTAALPPEACVAAILGALATRGREGRSLCS
jgi:chloramphenicol 3-O phosphotransferase